jgi:MFS family permease
MCGPLNPRRLAGLRWFWREAIFVQAAESFSTDYIPLFALAAGANTGEIALLAAVANLVSVAGYLPGAWIASRLRTRKAMVLAAAYGPGRLMLPLLAILPFMIPAGPTLVLLIIVVNALRIFGGSLGNASWTSFVADLVPQESRSRFFASRFIAIGLAALAASPLAGAIIRIVNGSETHALPGYQVALFCAFSLGLFSTWFFIRIPEPPSRSRTRLRGQARSLLSLLRRNPGFAWLAASSFLWGAALNMSGAFFNVFIVTELGGNAAYVGVIAGSYALTGLVGQLLFGRLSDSRGNRATFILTGLIIPFLPCLWAFATTPLHGVLINGLSGIFWAGYSLTSFNILLEMSPPEDRESAFALYQTAVAVSAVIGPLIGGVLIAAVGFRVNFVLSGAGRMVAMIVFIVMTRRAKKTAP